MLANNSGFPITQGRDEFEHRFSGPGLNQESISIRWVGEGTLAMRVPSSVSLEMGGDAGSGAHYSVDDAGLVVFGASGPHADKAIRRAAALIRALPNTPLCHLLGKDEDDALDHRGGTPRQSSALGRTLRRFPRQDYWRGSCPVTGVVRSRPTTRQPYEALGRLQELMRSASTSTTASSSPPTSTPPSTPRW